jgi:hypothetical protein
MAVLVDQGGEHQTAGGVTAQVMAHADSGDFCHFRLRGDVGAGVVLGHARVYRQVRAAIAAFPGGQ